MDVNSGAEKTNVKVEHLAAAMGPRVHKEPVPKNLLHLQDLLHQSKGRSVFEAVVAKDDADIYVNFTEMRQIVDSEKKADVKSDENQPAHWQKLNRTLNVYDKMLGGNLDKLGYDKEGNTDVAERVLVTRVLADIPGFVESIAISTGGKMSIEQVRNSLTNGKNFPPEFRKLAGEMIGNFIGNPELRRRMEKALSSVGEIIPPDDLQMSQEIEELKDKIKGKETLLQRKQALEDSKAKFKGLSSNDRQRAEDLYRRADQIYKSIKIDFQPASLTEGGIDAIMAQVRTQIQTADADISDLEKARFHKETLQSQRQGAQNNTTFETVVKDEEASKMYADKMREKSELNKALTQLESLKGVYGDSTQNELIQSYISFSSADEKLKSEVNPALLEVKDAEGKLKLKEAQRNKYMDKYKRKVERTLSEEMKKYWNEVKMEDAAEAAEAEAAEKKKLEAEAKTEAEKRAQKLEEMLNRYLRLSFMKYKGGKVVGWDDKAIKDFMHKDMLSQSPAQLARTFLEKIDDMSGSMPPQYQEEIAKMFKEMGVGKGEPPLTITKLLDGVDQKVYEGFAAKKVPDMLGYAWARGYYFDRMKLKPHEAEFIKEAYKDPEFFDVAIQSRKDQIALAEKLLNDDILSSGLTPELRKKIFGQDWTEGLNRLMKVLAVGAGAYTLGGGFAFGFDAPGLAAGAQHVADNIRGVGHLAGQALIATSRAGNMALHGIVGDWRTGIAGMPGQVDAMGNVITPPIPPNPNATKGAIGGMDQLLNKILTESKQGIPTP